MSEATSPAQASRLTVFNVEDFTDASQLGVEVMTPGEPILTITEKPHRAMGGLTVRLPDSLRGKASDLAEEEGISMNQLVMLAVSEKITRLDAEAQFAHLDALERFGEAVAEKEGARPDALMKDLLGRAGDEEPQEEDQRPTQTE